MCLMGKLESTATNAAYDLTHYLVCDPIEKKIEDKVTSDKIASKKVAENKVLIMEC